MDEAIEKIKNEGIGVVPTDTLYGIVGSAFSRRAVLRIYDIKGRDDNKPFIILISSLGDLARFGAEPDDRTKKFLADGWPAPLSVILPVRGPDFEYLHRGTESLAFRTPADNMLLSLLRETGPLVAPSANPQGKKPAATVSEAREYFGAALDFYIDGGVREGEPSTVVRVTDGEIEIVRAGAFRLFDKN